MERYSILENKLEEYLENNGFHYCFDCEKEDKGLDEPYDRYASDTLRIITGIQNDKILGLDKRDRVYDISLANKIAKCLYESNDNELKSVAWNSFNYLCYDKDFYLYDDFKLARDNYYHEDFASNHSKEINTERLIIKPNNNTDGNDLSKYIYDNDKSEYMFARMIRNYRSTYCLIFNLFDKKTNNIIGSIGLYSNSDLYDSTCNFAYYIKKEYRSKGYAKEGSIAVLNAIKNNEIVIYGEINRQYVLEEIKPSIKILIIQCDVNNMASFNLAKSLGFEYEGKFTSYIDKYKNPIRIAHQFSMVLV